MKKFKGFVIKEFYHIFRDRRTLLILFGIPIAQVLLFGFVIRNEVQDVSIAILDRSKDEVSKKITDKILSSGYFKLYKHIESSSEIHEMFKTGDVKEVIIFEEDFSEKLQNSGSADIQIIADASNANQANLIVAYTSNIIQNYIREQNSIAGIPYLIVPEVRMLYNEEMKSVYMFVPGIMAMILMLISAMMTSITIAREKEMGTMEILLVSPLRPHQIVIGKVAPYLILSFINAIMILLLAFFVFNVPITGSIILLLAESMLFIFHGSQ